MGKPVRLMKWSHSTTNDASTLDTGNGVHNVEWSVDSAFGVHPNFKSHVGGTMTFKDRRRSAINVSAKQKLNAKSSTVAELVGVDCMPPLALWVPPFLKEQGHDIKENIIKQDNKSATLLANSRIASLGKQTRAMNVCCFHSKDQIK